jgi:hypothetical protein
MHASRRSAAHRRTRTFSSCRTNVLKLSHETGIRAFSDIRAGDLASSLAKTSAKS